MTKGEEATDFAWRVHAALDSWTGKVDTKASITLAIESAVLGSVVTLSKNGERFSGLHDADLTWYRTGTAILILAILCALFVVMPQLNRREARRIWQSNMIYFGHLRHWEPADLSARLVEGPPYGEQLAQQLVAMSKIAWRKHARLQASLVLLMAAGACFLILGVRT